MARRLSKIGAVVEVRLAEARRLSVLLVGVEHVSGSVRRLSKIGVHAEQVESITRRRMSALRVMVEWSRARRGPRVQWL